MNKQTRKKAISPVNGAVLSPGPGRPKGSKNKLSATAKENIEWVFEAIGGKKAYSAWAQKSDRNRGIFYAQVYPKLLTQEVAHSGEVKTDGTLTIRVIETRDPGQ